MRYINSLQAEEITTLEAGFRYGPSARFRLRCQAILLSFQRKKIKELASLYHVDRDTISIWFDKWEKGGIAALMDSPRSGRPRKLDSDNSDHVEKVKALVAQESQQLEVVCQQLQEDLSIEISAKTLKRFLKSLVTDGNVLEYQSKHTKTP